MPYNPGVVDRSGEIWGKAINDTVSNVSDMIDRYTKQAKETKAYRTMAVDGLGMDPDAVDKMSPGELMGHLQGAALKRQQDMQQAQMTHLTQEDAYRQAQAARMQRQSGAMDNFNKLMAGSGGDYQPTNEDVTGLMSQAGLDPEQMRNVALSRKDMMDAMGGRAVDYQPKPFNVNGQEGLYNPHTGNFTLKGKDGEPGLIELHDEQGNPTGHQVMYDPSKGKMTLIKPTPTGALQPVLDPVSKKPVAGFGMDGTGKIHDLRSQVEKSVGTPAAPAAVGGPARKYNPATGRIE